MTFCASLAGFTSHIKLGTAVANLPFSHPVQLATQAALVDNLLEGRFLFGIGAGVLPSDAEALALLDADKGAMFAEAIDHILALGPTRRLIISRQVLEYFDDEGGVARSVWAASSSRSRNRIPRSLARRAIPTRKA